MKVTLPDGTLVLAHGRLDLVPCERPRTPDFALYLDERWSHDSDVTWPFNVIDWEDFGLPVSEPDTFDAIADLYRRAHSGELVEVACYGGVGRTGTVLGCLTVLSGLPPSEAIAWVRSHYHSRAVETPEQERFISRFARARGTGGTTRIHMATVDTRGWEPWQHEYAHGAFYVFPPREVAAAVDELRRRHDPASAAICDAHISLSEPLSAPLSDDQLRELRQVLGLIAPFDLDYGPLTQTGDHPGVVYAISPADRFFELRRAVHATSAFAGHPLSRAERAPHMTVAEFITIERAAKLLDELREAPTGTFRCDEVVLAAPDASFRFRPILSIPLGGSAEDPPM
jgi:2'-5' RNA ligase